MANVQRSWYIDDKTADRAYDFGVEQEARAYERAQLEDTRAYSRQVLSHLTEDAQAAGFNPLTVLRGGGASSYNAAAGLAPLSATRSFSSPPQLMQAASKQAVGGSSTSSAMAAVGDFLENFDPFADQKKEQEYQLVASQIAALNASALSGVPRGAGSYASGTTERRPSGAGGALGSSSSRLLKPSADNPDRFYKPIEAGDAPTISTLGMRTKSGRYGWFENPWTPDGNTFENNYGEGGGAIYGLGKMGLDLVYSAHRNRKSLVDDVSSAFSRAKVKPSAKARREYFKNIRESVPSLAR